MSESSGQEPVMDHPMYLVCRTCGSCCSLHGPAAHQIASDPPMCPGCHARMTVDAVPPSGFSRAS